MNPIIKSEWLTKEMYLRLFIGENSRAAQRSWAFLLRYGLSYGIDIVTESGREWESRFANIDKLQARAKVRVASLTNGIDRLIDAVPYGLGDATRRHLRALQKAVHSP